MALSSQGGLDFQQSRLQDPTGSLRASISDFGSLAQKFQDNKLKAEALAEAKAQQALENKRADEMMTMRKSEFDMQKSNFDTAQNTLRATSEAIPAMDKLATGQALLNEQVTKLIDPFNARITALAAKSGMTQEQFEQSDLMGKAVESGAFADLTGVGAKDALDGGSIGRNAANMLTANQKDMNVQKRLLAEFTPSFLKPDSDEAMLYDSSKINDYRQNLLGSLDTRIDREAARAQQAELERARLAQDAKQHRDRMLQQKEQDKKVYNEISRQREQLGLVEALDRDYYGKKAPEAHSGQRLLRDQDIRASSDFSKRQAQLNFAWNKLHPDNIVMRDGGKFYPKAKAGSAEAVDLRMDYKRFMQGDKQLADIGEEIRQVRDVRNNYQKYGLAYQPNQVQEYDFSKVVTPGEKDILDRAEFIRKSDQYKNASEDTKLKFDIQMHAKIVEAKRLADLAKSINNKQELNPPPAKKDSDD